MQTTKDGHLLDLVLSRIDRDAMRAAEAQFADVWAKKFFDVDQYVERAIEKAIALGLDKPASKRILDVGCGFGYLCVAAEALGHRAIGIDIPHPCTFAISTAIQFSFVPFVVEAFCLLPTLGEFDLITMIGVNMAQMHLGKMVFWGAAEYQFLISDLYRKLRPGGKIHLEHNRGPDTDLLKTVKWLEPFERIDNVITFTRPGV